MSTEIVEIRCENCAHYFTRLHDSKRRGRTSQYCSHRCRQAAYRERQWHAHIQEYIQQFSARLGEVIEERTIN